MKKYIIFLIKLFGYFIFKISCLFPRNSDKWLLGDIMGFSGNTKYILPEFLKINKKYGYKLFWITHSRKLVPEIEKHGIKAYYWLHPIAIYHCLTAGVYIVTDCTKDINAYLNGNAYYVTLRHGISLKGVGRQSKIYKSIPPHKRNSFYYQVLFFYWIYRTPDLCLVTSEFMLNNIYLEQYGISKEHFILGMYPRNRILFKSKEEIKSNKDNSLSEKQLEIISLIEKYNKTYIYMPTWRDNGRNFIETAGFDLSILNNILIKNNELFIFKLHSKTIINLEKIKNYSNIIVLNNSYDIYPILPFTDMLITDYSSIYTDYLLLKKDIVIFDFDKEEYMSKDRDLLLDFDKYTPGTRAHDFSELCSIISNHTDCHIPNYDEVMDIYWGAKDNPLNVFEEIRKRL